MKIKFKSGALEQVDPIRIAIPICSWSKAIGGLVDKVVDLRFIGQRFKSEERYRFFKWLQEKFSYDKPFYLLEKFISCWILIKNLIDPRKFDGVISSVFYLIWGSNTTP